jgi:hypothetical protein
MAISKKTKQNNHKLFVEDLKKATTNSKTINPRVIKIIEKKTKRNRIKKFDFLTEIVNVANKIYPRTSPNIKYTHRELLTCLIHFATTHISWNKYIGMPEIKISGKYLNSVHLKYIEKGVLAEPPRKLATCCQLLEVYTAINEKLIEIYLKNNKCAKLKHQSMDSSFIANKKGVYNPSNKKNTREYDNMPLIKNNRYNGRKKYIKVSHLVDSNGVVLSSFIFPGTTSDFKSVEGTFKKLNINLNTKKYSKNNKYKQYFLADSGYDSKKINEFVKELGYTPIIKPNNRNRKKRPKRKLTKSQLKHYKNRQIVESSFAWLKEYAIANQIYEKTISSYNGLLQLINSIILSKKIIKEHEMLRNKA